MTKNERALKAAETIRKYCQSISIDCAGCIFKWKGCMLNDPDNLPETWELEKIGKNVLYCEYDRYSINVDDENGTGDLFIGVEFDGRDKYGRKFGAAAPRDSIQEAIEWFRGKMTA